MIRDRRQILKALCDACGAKLSSECQEDDETGVARGVHFARLVNHCGYGSDMDAIVDNNSSLDLCEACYQKALDALGFPRHRQIPEHLRLDSVMRLIENDQPFQGEVGKEIYHTPMWICKYCDWTLSGKGRALPDHLCETVKEIEKASKEVCFMCLGGVNGLEAVPHYSQREETWVHWRFQSSEAELCLGRALREAKIRPDQKF